MAYRPKIWYLFVMLRKPLIYILIISFSFTMVITPKAFAEPLLSLPEPGKMINLSMVYHPAIIKGMTVNKSNPFLFDFIVDPGQDNLTEVALKQEGNKLIKYFLAALTVPAKDLWVNLSPYEKNRTINNALGQTDMGRDLLAQDYILKQITASLIYPEKDLGKTFWDKVYKKKQETFGNIQVPVNTFNKVWIMADQSEVYEHGQTAYVTKSHLKVMLEEDYLATHKHAAVVDVKSSSSAVIREVILPELEKEINEGKNFAALRQIFNSIILAGWYKNNLKDSLLTQAYANKSTVQGIDLADKTIKTQIYERYLQAYKKGVFNYVKEGVGSEIPKKYFSGGIDGAMAGNPKIITNIGMNADLKTDNSMFAPLSKLFRVVLEMGKKTDLNGSGVNGSNVAGVNLTNSPAVLHHISQNQSATEEGPSQGTFFASQLLEARANSIEDLSNKFTGLKYLHDYEPSSIKPESVKTFISETVKFRSKEMLKNIMGVLELLRQNIKSRGLNHSGIDHLITLVEKGYGKLEEDSHGRNGFASLDGLTVVGQLNEVKAANQSPEKESPVELSHAAKLTDKLVHLLEDGNPTMSVFPRVRAVILHLLMLHEAGTPFQDDDNTRLLFGESTGMVQAVVDSIVYIDYFPVDSVIDDGKRVLQVAKGLKRNRSGVFLYAALARSIQAAEVVSVDQVLELPVDHTDAIGKLGDAAMGAQAAGLFTFLGGLSSAKVWSFSYWRKVEGHPSRKDANNAQDTEAFSPATTPMIRIDPRVAKLAGYFIEVNHVSKTSITFSEEEMEAMSYILSFDQNKGADESRKKLSKPVLLGMNEAYFNILHNVILHLFLLEDVPTIELAYESEQFINSESLQNLADKHPFVRKLLELLRVMKIEEEDKLQKTVDVGITMDGLKGVVKEYSLLPFSDEETEILRAFFKGLVGPNDRLRNVILSDAMNDYMGLHHVHQKRLRGMVRSFFAITRLNSTGNIGDNDRYLLPKDVNGHDVKISSVLEQKMLDALSTLYQKKGMILLGATEHGNNKYVSPEAPNKYLGTLMALRKQIKAHQLGTHIRKNVTDRNFTGLEENMHEYLAYVDVLLRLPQAFMDRSAMEMTQQFLIRAKHTLEQYTVKMQAEFKGNQYTGAIIFLNQMVNSEMNRRLVALKGTIDFQLLALMGPRLVAPRIVQSSIDPRKFPIPANKAEVLGVGAEDPPNLWQDSLLLDVQNTTHSDKGASVPNGPVVQSLPGSKYVGAELPHVSNPTLSSSSPSISGEFTQILAMFNIDHEARKTGMTFTQEETAELTLNVMNAANAVVEKTGDTQNIMDEMLHNSDPDQQFYLSVVWIISGRLELNNKALLRSNVEKFGQKKAALLKALFDEISGAGSIIAIGRDQAMANGGIDLVKTQDNTAVKKDGPGVTMKFDPAMIERVKREGIDSLSPVIYQISPMTNIRALLGLDITPQDRLAGA